MDLIDRNSIGVSLLGVASRRCPTWTKTPGPPSSKGPTDLSPSAQRASSTADAGRHQVQQSSSVSCCCYPMRFYSITTMRCCQNIKSHLPERDSDDTTAGTLSCQVPSNRACRLAESKSISLESGTRIADLWAAAATRAARRLGRCECGGTRRRPDR